MSHSSSALTALDELEFDGASAPFPLAWDRQLRPLVEGIGSGIARAALIGTAGSGKSTVLQRLRDLLHRQSRVVRLLHDVDDDPLPAEHVLLVDDLHLLSDEQLRLIALRADDPAASLIVASRPWPASSAARAITTRLEQDAPAVVLGHVSRSDVLDHLAMHERIMLDACIDHILERTCGVAWLVAAALQHHDARDCGHDGDHDELDEALGELIAHRLSTVPTALRELVEEVCLVDEGVSAATDDRRAGQADVETLIARGHAEGLLLANGGASPLVRSVVCGTISTQRLIELSTRFPEHVAQRDDIRPIRSARLADSITETADRLLTASPRRALELYDSAIASGADEDALAARRARAAWMIGDLEHASRIVETALGPASRAQRDALAPVSAALWSARAMMDRAHAVFQLVPPRDAAGAAGAVTAALGVGSAPEPGRERSTAEFPSTLSVSMELLTSGMLASIEADADDAVLPGLVRSAEMYTQAHSSEALCELPAVIAAVVALSLGRPATAHAVLEEAIAHDHGGAWARRRLLLWSAWVAVQRAQPSEARDLLERSETATAGPVCARDALLMHAVRVAIARRYDDASGLEAAWREARVWLLRADIDLYLLHPLGELVSAAARLGDTARVDAHLAHGFEIVEALGDPPLWAAHVHWAGIQQGILLSSPERLAPHARALVKQASRSRVAAAMARAGRVWTDVLAGTVDPDAVISAAQQLAGVGLMWDAARLAGHGAARACDRRVAAQLLACARELHPNDGLRRPAPATDDDAPAQTQSAPQEVLSDRELEVARLVVLGKTYAEIGETIFISPRTAEHHIAHIRRRLGAASRSELIARLRMLLGEGAMGDQPP